MLYVNPVLQVQCLPACAGKRKFQYRLVINSRNFRVLTDIHSNSFQTVEHGHYYLYERVDDIHVLMVLGMCWKGQNECSMDILPSAFNKCLKVQIDGCPNYQMFNVLFESPGKRSWTSKCYYIFCD